MKNSKFILNYLKPFKKKYIFLLFVVIITSLTNMINPFLSGRFVDELAGNKNLSLLLTLPVIMFLVVIIKGALNYFYQMQFEKISQKVSLNLKSDLYKKLLDLDFYYYNTTNTGETMTLMTNDVGTIKECISSMIYTILSNLSLFAFAIISMGIVNLPLTLLMFMICPFILFLTFKMNTKLAKPFFEIRDCYAKLNSVIEENLSGNKTVRAFHRGDYEIKKFDVENKNYKNKNLKIAFIIAKYISLIEMFSNFLSLILLLFGGIFVIKGHMTIGDLTIFSSLIWALNTPINVIPSSLNNIQRFITSYSKISEILNYKCKINNIENPIPFSGMHESIVFDNVSFKFGDTYLLKNISFKAKAGEQIGIIGSTGCGKTTLANLICRFYDPSEGNIFIDGKNIKDFDLKLFHKSIGISMQNPFLFSETIKTNICYGNPSASDNEIESVAKIAQIHDFIDSLPDKYETIIGEKGVGLSGGQKQRISLARTLLTKPSVLILDDTTSAIDVMTESKIQNALKKNENRTTFVISNRISSVQNSDIILVLSQGKIIEQGTHDELINNGGYYYDTYEQQMNNILEKVGV
ncbi:ABC-type multidrug transport system [Clostridium bornimense]|uniref:ABC-type multidrug transport system n=1 Tax=Clostridium bornimense TaxID=1216932 RepID=W6S331_9CLOT|nr:ABC transporter ATP-binding protein [Clostridium bornimense]CDM70319.1 ABC-type multidrug transport system [Clostridium bornimense]